MKCLTIKQPWAWLIFNDSGMIGLKNIENRTWHTKIRGTVAIHTSKSIDVRAYNELKLEGHNLPLLPELELGKIIGIVDITDSVDNHSSFWKEFGSVGFVLEKPIKLSKTIPLKGQLGFFDIHVDIEKEILRDLDNVK